MGRVNLEIGDSQFPVDCRDGEEPRLELLGRIVAERWPDAERAAGNAGPLRTMLLTALMLADDLADANDKPAPAADDAALDSLAVRLERIAAALEQSAASA